MRTFSICDFAYMQLELWHFRGTHPPIYHYYNYHYTQTDILAPYISHITKVKFTSLSRVHLGASLVPEFLSHNTIFR